MQGQGNGVRGGSTRETWNSSDFTRRDRFPAWEAAVSEAYLPWMMVRAPEPEFEARISRLSIDDFRLIHCACDPVQGYRRMREIARTEGAYYSVLYIVDGREDLRIRDREVSLRSGDFVLWDSAATIEFTVPERLRKLTLTIPKARLENVLPFAADYVGVAVDGRTGIGALWASHLLALDEQIDQIDQARFGGVMQASLELLAQSYGAVGVADQRPPRAYALDRVRRYILANLADEDMTPQSIAAANRMSPRYLHMIFEGTGTTLSGWILEQRLGRCAALLTAPECAGYQITDIALRCGFKDGAHFSRVFKKHHGVSPRQFRQERLCDV